MKWIIILSFVALIIGAVLSATFYAPAILFALYFFLSVNLYYVFYLNEDGNSREKFDLKTEAMWTPDEEFVKGTIIYGDQKIENIDKETAKDLKQTIDSWVEDEMIPEDAEEIKWVEENSWKVQR